MFQIAGIFWLKIGYENCHIVYNALPFKGRIMEEHIILNGELSMLTIMARDDPGFVNWPRNIPE